MNFVSDEASLGAEFRGEKIGFFGERDRHRRLEETEAVCAMRSGGLDISIKYSDNWVFLNSTLVNSSLSRYKQAETL